MLHAVIVDFFGVIFNPATGQPMPGLVEFLQQLRNQHWPCAIASSSTRHTIEQFLADHQLVDYFSSIVSLEDVHNAKPDPECFLLAAEQLQIMPLQCVVIDDTPASIQAAHQVGFVTFLFTGQFPDVTALDKSASVPEINLPVY
ncbi:MAG: HAD family hydrolase [Candidatus Kerfeldbacteria bacterium]|nr:HAD family hydrolase [Candidatus Kerfeldbacteria bacterium]